MFLVLAGKSVITAIVRGFRAVVAQSELLWIHSVPQMALTVLCWLSWVKTKSNMDFKVQIDCLVSFPAAQHQDRTD